MVTENSNKTLRTISAEITKEQKEAILNYLHGMVHLWCKIKGLESFHAYDLVGKNDDSNGNYYWNGTPLYPLYEYYKQKNYKDPVFVGVNGRTYLVERGVTVSVPRMVAEVIERSEAQKQKAEAFISDVVSRSQSI